jgi:hypothetical protein
LYPLENGSYCTYALFARFHIAEQTTAESKAVCSLFSLFSVLWSLLVNCYCPVLGVSEWHFQTHHKPLRNSESKDQQLFFFFMTNFGRWENLFEGFCVEGYSTEELRVWTWIDVWVRAKFFALLLSDASSNLLIGGFWFWFPSVDRLTIKAKLFMQRLLL